MKRSYLTFLLCVAFAVPLRASPGAVTLSWNYDATAKVVTIHVMNATNKDITAYAINVTIKHPDGNADTSEMFRSFLSPVALSEQRNDNGTLATGTSDDIPLPQTKDVTNVIIVLDVVAYLDGTAEVHNREAFNHILALRKGLLLATQQVNQAISNALTSPDPKTAAVKEIKRLADVAKAANVPPNDPNFFTEIYLLGMISEVETSKDLREKVKENQAKIAILAPHTQLKEVRP